MSLSMENTMSVADIATKLHSLMEHTQDLYFDVGKLTKERSTHNIRSEEWEKLSDQINEAYGRITVFKTEFNTYLKVLGYKPSW